MVDPHKYHGEFASLRDPNWMLVPATVYYVIVCVIGVLGNLATCLVIARNKHMHTTTNFYLFSLAISDLVILIIGIPSTTSIIWLVPHPIYESCKVTGVFSGAAENAATLMVIGVSVDKFIAICHPSLAKTISRPSVVVIYNLAVWTGCLCLEILSGNMLNDMVYLEDINGVVKSYCSPKPSVDVHTYNAQRYTTLLLVLPLIIVVYVLMAVRQRSSSRKTKQLTVTEESSASDKHGPLDNSPHNGIDDRNIKMLVAVVVIFFAGLVPVYILVIFTSLVTFDHKALGVRLITYALLMLYFLSCAINPILYSLMSTKFRNAFKESWTPCLFRNRSPPDHSRYDEADDTRL